MNQYIKAMMISLVVISLLMACSENTNKSNDSSQNEQHNNDNEAAEKNQENDANDEESDVEQIIKEATKINNEFESYSTIEERDTVETFNDEENHLFAKEETNIIFSPFQLELKIEQEQLDDSDHLQKDFFAKEGGIYLVDGMSYMLLQGEEWSKKESGYTEEELQEQEKIHLDKLVQLYRDVSVDKNFEETDDHYILIFNLDLEQIAKNDQESDSGEMGFSSEGYKVEEMDVAIEINKDTLYLETITTNKSYSYDMEYNEEKGKMSITYENIITYQNQNDVKEIVVPDEVLENAEEL